MTELTELTAAKHSALRVVPKRVLDVIKTRHLINIRVNEVGQATSCFPCFVTRANNSSSWALSAVSGLELGKNLFLKEEQWNAIYQPSSMQTYPFHLMKSPKDETKFAIGFDPQSNALSENEGEPLFEDGKKASLYLSRISALLEANINNDIQTFEFTKKLSELGLIKSINVLVEHDDGTVNTVKGLHTIDEDKLQSLSAEDFEGLRSKGYLAPIYALLISVFQLNSLLQKHNAATQGPSITQIRLEVAKGLTH